MNKYQHIYGQNKYQHIYGSAPQEEQEEPLWEKQQREREEERKRKNDYLICDVSCNDIYNCI